jgi:4'-phosphopantetheinyl transferase
VAQLESLLTPDERDRAGRFHFDRLRHSFILARGSLRLLLGRYLGAAPAGVRFAYGEKGKPALADPSSRLHFNASHSGGIALCAFTLDCEIGVDVEQMRPLPDMQGIARRFFCAEESGELMALPEHQREAAFFRCWTRKEAYIKAIGDGLSAPLDGFAVTLRPDEPARLKHIANNTAAGEAWTLQNAEASPGYAAAVAYRGSPRVLRQANASTSLPVWRSIHS